MMSEASEDTVDSTVLPGFELNDMDADALAYYRRRYQTRLPASLLKGYNDLEFLRAISEVNIRKAGQGARGMSKMLVNVRLAPSQTAHRPPRRSVRTFSGDVSALLRILRGGVRTRNDRDRGRGRFLHRAQLLRVK